MKKRLIGIICSVAIASVAASAGAMPDKAGASATQPPGHGSMGGAAASGSGEALSGKVLQTMNSGGYTYVYLEKKDGSKVWVAVTETKVRTGSQISFQPGMEMRNFESKTLKRTFDSIIFAGGVITPAGTPSASASQNSPGSSGASTAKEGKISVAKAEGSQAYTIAEIFAKSAKLNKKKITVRGKVVKVSSGIMSRNWIHLQDGTGSEARKNHNLVCTSSATADVGDVVTITGTLIKDKDFGSGYKYAVIVENATVSKK